MAISTVRSFPRSWNQVRGAVATIAILLMTVCRGEGVANPQTTSTNRAGASMETREYSETRLKAALLVRLTPYFRWPETEATGTNQPVRIGVLGKNPFGDSLNELTRPGTNSVRGFQIVYGAKPEQLKGCQVIFIAAEPPPNWVEIRREWVAKPVLLVGDQPDFIEQGGMVNLLIRKKLPYLQIKRRTIEAVGIRVKGLLDNTKHIEWVP